MKKSLLENFYRYVAQTSSDPQAIEVASAEGVFIFDKHGKRYFDLISGIAVSNMGHTHPVIIKAIKQQIDKYLHLMVYGEFVQEPQVELATLLCEYLPPSLNSVYFVNSGSEAVEGALKLAKRATHRQEIVYFKNAYHGATHGAMSVMGNLEYQQAFTPLLPATKAISFGIENELEQITEQTAAFIVELVQGEAGVRMADANYWKQVRQRCSDTGTLLIVDEIQTGLGRTGKLFAFEHYDIEPDILLLAKAFGGGMPLGAFIANKQIMNELTYNPVLGHITTFGGHPVSCAAALAHLKLIVEGEMWKKAESIGNRLTDIFSKINSVKEIRHIGALLAIDFENPIFCNNMLKRMLDKGIISDWFLWCNTALRIAPPLILNQQHLDEIEYYLKFFHNRNL